jgi:hypothetical protein
MIYVLIGGGYLSNLFIQVVLLLLSVGKGAKIAVIFTFYNETEMCSML